MVGQVLDHRQVEIEGARLEHHADQAQRFARRAFDVVPEDADVTALDAVEAGHQREQRALARAVEAEQNREVEGAIEKLVVERLAGAVEWLTPSIATAGGSMVFIPCIMNRAALGKRSSLLGDRDTHGSSPTWIVLIT